MFDDRNTLTGVRLIDANAILPKMWPDGNRRLVENAPTVNARPIIYCQWECVDEDMNCWRCTHCKNEWVLEAGNPSDNEMNFCSYCGAEVQVGADDEKGGY